MNVGSRRHTHASNGPGTPEDEGLSYVRSGQSRFLLKDAVENAV